MAVYYGAIMTRTTIMLPDDLKSGAVREARARGISMGELIRELLRETLERVEARQSRSAGDPLFADSAVFAGDVAADTAVAHDDYLYDFPHE